MDKIVLICITLYLFCGDLSAQHRKTSFSTLSGPEKWWVVCHPFKAKKAFEATVRTLQLTDSLKATGTIGTDINGGRLDAFKHSFWMAELSRHIGEKAALSLGNAHEKGNYRDFLHGNPEDGSLPDKASSDMDDFNNKMGIRIFRKYQDATENKLVETVVAAILNGEMRILKKENAIFLRCTGEPVQTEEFIGKWENDKCLVPSNTR